MNEPQPSPVPVVVPGIAGLALIAGVLCYRGISVSQMRAWPIELAARLCGLCGRTLASKTKSGHLKTSHHGLISAVELDRYLASRVI